LDSSSYTSDSSGDLAGTGRRTVLYRLTLFLAPIVLMLGLLQGLGYLSGETMPAGWAAQIQHGSQTPILYLPALSDHNFAFKLEATRLRQPDVLILGQSRSNQWRAGMFAGSFYNASQSTYSIADEIAFLKALEPYAPKVLVIPVDFYQFDRNWEAVYARIARDDMALLDANSVLYGASLMVKQVIAAPLSLLRLQVDPASGFPAIGLTAGASGLGFRPDGSFTYAFELPANRFVGANVEDIEQRIQAGRAPFLFNQGLDASRMRQFEELVSSMAAKGTKVIGITMPFHPAVAAMLRASPNHGGWAAFRSPAFRQWIDGLDMSYFDFTDLSSFGGNEGEFVDTMHPSEAAYVRMLIAMIDREGSGALLARDVGVLREMLSKIGPLYNGVPWFVRVTSPR
jgi:hypothetical protein